jgi:IclR family pca regulon transcriptional regulator
LRKLSHDHLADLRDRSACTASIAVLDGKDIVYIDRARSSLQGQSEVVTRLGRGSRLPASRTAMGRALLAHRSEQEQRDAIGVGAEQATSEAQVASQEKLINELERIRERGYAIADQVHVGGQRCVAAPLRSRSTEVIAAVDVAAAKSMFSRAEVLERLVPMLMASAEEMSAHLGYPPL